MKADDARRLRELERKNARLKRIVADKELEIDALSVSDNYELELEDVGGIVYQIVG